MLQKDYVQAEFFGIYTLIKDKVFWVTLVGIVNNQLAE